MNIAGTIELAANKAPDPSVQSVVLTGMVIVFAMLILFVLIFTAFSKIMGAVSNIGKKKSESPKNATPSATAENAPTPSVVICEDDDEIIAVIAAAVDAIYADTGKKPIIKSIKPSRSQKSAWAAAGVRDNIRAF